MNLIRQVQNFVLEKDFKINYTNNKIEIINYTNISHFDETKILINYEKGTLIISGNNLVVSKLLIDELLIEGSIDKIEFRWNYEFNL